MRFILFILAISLISGCSLAISENDDIKTYGTTKENIEETLQKIDEKNPAEKNEVIINPLKKWTQD